MGRQDRQDRIPGHPTAEVGLASITGERVVLAGFFSAKQKDYEARMGMAAGLVNCLGGVVVAHIVQRRGVSRGGVAAMSRPLSPRTLVSSGKAREIAAACAEKNARVVVFVNELSEHQRNVLSEVCAVPVVSLALAARLILVAGQTQPRRRGNQCTSSSPAQPE
jgi:50S ribosomal subunit-associated GTPase HflX